jgi:hypothetical protein
MFANPVRRVVTMMQKMQKQIEEEGKKKEEMFDRFMCFCKGDTSGIEDAVDKALGKIPQLQSNIKEAKGSKSQLEGDVSAAKGDREEAKATLAKAKAIRDKEASDYAKEVAETKANIKALSKAIPAIEQGMGGAFLQANTGVSQRLQSLSVSMDMEAADRDLLASFLSDGGSAHPGTGEVLGILKQMKEDMEKDLAEVESAEADQQKDYLSLTSAKSKEVNALNKAVEGKLVRWASLLCFLLKHSMIWMTPRR